MRPTVIQFFAAHPEHWDGVKRAHYAYHRGHREAGAHYFAGSWREAPCRWCSRTREQVRWEENVPIECQQRPAWADESIESVIAREEQMFARVLDRAKALAATIDLSTLTGEELSRLHHTHGVDPSMLEVALMEAGRGSIPQRLHDEYQVAYAEHRKTGGRGLVKEIIVAKTLDGA
jgi:hypothetical protein